MDDLTQLKGIGKATAGRLVAGGIDSFASLAAATPEQLGAIDKLGGTPAEWLGWVDQAKALAQPVSRPLSNAELVALVQSWDDARTELDAAGEAVAAIHLQMDALDADADPTQLDADLTAAQERVNKAKADIAALIPLPEGLRLPDARKKEIPADPQSGTDTAAPGSGEGSAENAALDTDAVAGASDLISPAVRAVLLQKAADRGQTLEELFADSLAALAEVGRDELLNDIDTGEADPWLDALGDTLLIRVDLLAADRGLDRAQLLDMALTALIDVDDLRNQAATPVIPGPVPADLDLPPIDGFVRVTVTGPKAGRWRAGRHFTSEAATIDVSEDDKRALENDPLLTVSAVTD